LYFFPHIFMKSVNKVTLLGNVTHDPELKSIAGGQTVCTFGLATNRTWKDKAGDMQSVPEFHNMVAWRGLGEFCGKYLKKGKPLFVEGYLKTGSWEKDGVKHHRTEVIAENIVLLGPKDKSPEGVETGEPVTV
jgi:single-strand DNA-binding protein